MTIPEYDICQCGKRGHHTECDPLPRVKLRRDVTPRLLKGMVGTVIGGTVGTMIVLWDTGHRYPVSYKDVDVIEE